MPFVQRVVKPTRLAQVVATNLPIDRFQCMPGKCKNNNCINKADSEEVDKDETVISIKPNDEVYASSFNANCENGDDDDDDDDDDDEAGENNNEADGGEGKGKECNGGHRLAGHAKDADIRIATQAVVHNNNNQQIYFVQMQTPKLAKTSKNMANNVDGDEIENISMNFNVNANNSTLTNGCGSSFTYGTDTEDISTCTSRAMPQTFSPLKKLKQHVEFLPPTSPTHLKAQQIKLPKDTTTTGKVLTSIKSTTSAIPSSKSSVKLVTGYEFESISNITLSNALRQLASLVLLASDIFDDLQRELQNVGERTRTVQRKIIAVEQRVTAFDPKLVTVRKYFYMIFVNFIVMKAG